jgi:hypothetical protein
MLRDSYTPRVLCSAILMFYDISYATTIARHRRAPTLANTGMLNNIWRRSYFDSGLPPRHGVNAIILARKR